MRYATKLRFMMGLAKRMNEMTGNEANPAVMTQMGELAALAQTVESMLRAQEAMATIDADGVLWPSRATLYAVMALQSEMNPRMIDMIRELAGGAMITLPSSAADFDNPEMARDIERYMRSATTDARERIALMRMAWDFIGTEFGSRHQQYEKFYGGASFVVKQNVYRNYDFKRAPPLVDAALALPPVGAVSLTRRALLFRPGRQGFGPHALVEAQFFPARLHRRRCPSSVGHTFGGKRAPPKSGSGS